MLWPLTGVLEAQAHSPTFLQQGCRRSSWHPSKATLPLWRLTSPKQLEKGRCCPHLQKRPKVNPGASLGKPEQVLLEDLPGKAERVDREIYEGDIMTTTTEFGTEGGAEDVIYLHFSGTFETTSLSTLVSGKDVMLWIGGQINQFKIWLDDWAQRAVINKHYCDWGQESVLGPVLFETVPVIYISDVSKKVAECTLTEFADDTNWEAQLIHSQGRPAFSDLDRLEGWATGGT